MPKGPTVYARCSTCNRDLSEDPQTRSLEQNKLIHAVAEELALELNSKGLDMRTVLKPGVDIPWDKELIKRHIFHPLIKAMFNKDSTTKLSTVEVSKMFDVLNKHFAEKWQVTLRLPDEV